LVEGEARDFVAALQVVKQVDAQQAEGALERMMLGGLVEEPVCLHACVEHVDDGELRQEEVDRVNNVALQETTALDRLIKGEVAPAGRPTLLDKLIKGGEYSAEDGSGMTDMLQEVRLQM
jgi:hypothetical protein